MTIRMSCPDGHAQDLLIDPSRAGNVMVAGFLGRMSDEVAALLDGTSKLYALKPSPPRCYVPGCGKPVKATVVQP